MPLIDSKAVTSQSRIDARLKVTGEARYTADLQLGDARGGPLHAVVVQSPVASGTLVDLETEAALQAPGVRGIMTWQNAPRLKQVTTLMATELDRLLPLQEPDICYKGQAIAVVITDTLLHAQYAASLVLPRFADEGEAARLSFADEIPNATEAKKVGAGEHGTLKRGKPESAFAQAPLQLDRTYSTAVTHHNALEPGCATAAWDEDGRLTVHTATQFTYGDAVTLANAFGLGMREGKLRLGAHVAAGYEIGSKVTVIARFVGGGFGSKGENQYLILAAMAAKMAGSAVRLVLTREQTYTLMPYRSASVQRIRLGSDREGALQAILHDSTIQNSNVAAFVEPTGEMTPHIYKCASVRTTHRLVRLNFNAPSWMRAPGVAPGLFALECAMDELAEEIGIDPIEIRLRNYADVDPATGHPWSSKSLRECYTAGAERIGWSTRETKPRSMREGDFLVGFGMGTAAYRTMQFPASARIILHRDGSAVVQSAFHEIGQGAITALTQIAAESLALPPSSIRLEWGDARLPFAPLTAASTTTLSVGSAIREAAEKLKRQLAVLAVVDKRSPLYNTRSGTIDSEDGRLYSRKAPDRAESYGAILSRRGMASLSAKAVTGRLFGKSRYARAAFGAQFAKVGVHAETGEVRVQHLVGAFSAGRIINAKLASSQVRGAIIWGLGQALMEESMPDERVGGWVNGNLAEALVPTNSDVPRIDPILIQENDSRGSTLGVKGIGEIGITGVAAAIANAVHHATGHRIYELPIKPDVLLRRALK
ncbi:MAG: xanthine dehydrogenase family protein molybdopterin-binding subunit [Bryobacteraceae bacterium]